ncbi:MAG TPA: hypothetical protein VK666_03620, partial [Chryseolinea sp.]|nr:hypothetical protein [Chryseolinea sp.]
MRSFLRYLGIGMSVFLILSASPTGAQTGSQLVKKWAAQLDDTDDAEFNNLQEVRTALMGMDSPTLMSVLEQIEKMGSKATSRYNV